MLLPALPTFNVLAAKNEGVTISARDGGVRIDFVGLLATTELVRGMGTPSVVTTDTRLVIVTNTGSNDFVVAFQRGNGGTGAAITPGQTRVLSVPTDQYGSFIRIEQPPIGAGEMSGTLIIQ
jgi:hypothetical protein